jgi:UDPglucose--hexose-1-phosphate uridylyltransferase
MPLGYGALRQGVIMNLQDHPHRRYNILMDEWILVSPHRTKRPWQGKTEDTTSDEMPEYDETCYLCPGNTRAGGHNNPDYNETFVFTNDFSALLPDSPVEEMNEKDLLIAQTDNGICKVICFSPKHNLTLAKMEVPDIKKVVDVWTKEYEKIGKNEFINYVQIFENRGAVMGCSNPHPHGQIWSNTSIPTLPAKELETQSKYLKEKKTCMLCDYLFLESKDKERIIFENDTFVVLVPFWAIWPYEVMILPKIHFASLLEMNDDQKMDLADAMHRMGIKYDNLFQTSFPYSMGLHQKPTDGNPHDEWHFHIHYYPPLLRSATVKKFMVGYEMLGMSQRDITAEGAAKQLRELPEIHYSRK